MVHAPMLPDNAPFTPAQRAWLNGFFAGLLNQQIGQEATPQIGAAAMPAGLPTGLPITASSPTASPAAAPVTEEEYPWHDPSLPLAERMALAESKPFKRRLMAAMGQLDCGQCGYDCKGYAEAIADGRETKLSLCQPGGRETQRMLKALLAEAGGGPPPADAAPPPSPAAPILHAVPAPARPEPADRTAAAATPGRDNPVPVRLAASQPLTVAGSAKDTRHVVFDIADSGLRYEAGDSLGIHPEHCPDLVEAVIRALGADGSEEVGDGNGHSRTLRQALAAECDLRTPDGALFALLADCATDRAERERLQALARDEDAEGLSDTLDVLDVLASFPSARPAPRRFVAALGPLQPRLYSIASSPKRHPDQVHLTVGVVATEARGRRRKGVASTFLAERAAGRPVRAFVQPSPGFRPPADGALPMIMIGPGTGIAPFRAFLQDRRATGTAGRSWLFFGNPHSSTDFLYREELEGWLKDGTLSRLDTAFSRDQGSKIYVQHRMAEAGAEFWAWLQDGASVYVCGDARRMARDVDQALRRIAAEHGRLSDTDAKAYVAALARDGRYRRDVY